MLAFPRRQRTQFSDSRGLCVPVVIPLRVTHACDIRLRLGAAVRAGLPKRAQVGPSKSPARSSDRFDQEIVEATAEGQHQPPEYKRASSSQQSIPAIAGELPAGDRQRRTRQLPVVGSVKVPSFRMPRVPARLGARRGASDLN
eukprot:6173917-Pleurochrysis_carterae.AAC.2